MNMPLSAEDIFLQALEFPDDDARQRYLRDVCRTDDALRATVDALLADHEQATAFIHSTTSAFTRHGDWTGFLDEPAAPDADIGSDIGPYRLVRHLGEGGGGLVYEAEQETPVRRKVALKILRPGMDACRVIARFEAERQALALMEHPHIARVIDAGETDTGRPYFVMELVHGAKITDYCELHALPVTARLQLMRQVCLAVQHAHQKGLIHRDLKPSNILVTQVDGVPVPKIIDFGIAKASHRRPAEDPDPLAGTPAYMSPEQVSEDADIDTRSDIYSLGVVLYELIASRPPFDNQELLRAGPDAMRHRLQTEEPPPPSHARANSRHAPDELDLIIIKALRKDRERRYQSARALANDLARLLNHEPVEAHPPSRRYRIRKLIRRNQLACAAFALAILTLLAGFTTSTYLFIKAQAAEQQQARLRAEAEEREHVTKAAILLMQNKPAEADAEIRGIGGILTQPSVEASNVFRALATWSAMNGDWKTSAERLIALTRVNRFDDADTTDNASRDLLPVAPTLVTAGDLKAYDEFKQLLLSRLGKTQNPTAAEHVLKACLQLPSQQRYLSALKPIAAVAEHSMGPSQFPPRNRLDAWRCAVLGLWHYRNGRPQEARTWCDRSLAFKDNEQVREVYCLLVHAMASWKAGHDSEAQTNLEAARSRIVTQFQRPLEYEHEGSWNDWLCVRIFLGEATKLILPTAKP